MRVNNRLMAAISISKKLNIGQTYTIITRRYCDPMTTAGLCPADCDFCADSLQQLTEVAGAKAPYGMMTYMCRDHVAQAKERRSDKKLKPVSDVENAEVNPFASILEGL